MRWVITGSGMPRQVTFNSSAQFPLPVSERLDAIMRTEIEKPAVRSRETIAKIPGTLLLHGVDGSSLGAPLAAPSETFRRTVLEKRPSNGYDRLMMLVFQLL